MTRSTVLAVIAVIVCIVSVGAFWVKERPVLLSFGDPGELQRPSVVVLNPLRDKAPEQAAEQLLGRLRLGDLTALGVALNTAEDPAAVREKERLYPIRKWRLANREDTATEVTLLYRAARGTSARLDSPLIIRLKRSSGGKWLVTTFNPIY